MNIRMDFIVPFLSNLIFALEDYLMQVSIIQNLKRKLTNSRKSRVYHPHNLKELDDRSKLEFSRSQTLFL